MGMVPLGTVLTYFISGFVQQKWIIGLLTFLNVLLTFTPQILVSKKLEKLKHFKPFLLLNGLVMRILWLLLGLDVIFFAKSSPLLFIISFYIIFSLIGLTSAFTGITWLNFIVKIIPVKYRGRYIGIRATICGLFESLGALFMGIIISNLSYPLNYGILLIIVFIVSMVSLWALTYAKEDEHDIEENLDNEKKYFSKMKDVIKTDKNFVYYLFSVAFIGGLGKMILAFQIIIAKEKLGILIEHVSIATFILLISQTLGYLIWGFLSDKYGFKKVLVISGICFIPATIFTFLMSNIFIFYISMFFFGVAQSARNINENNLAINLCNNQKKQPLYIGLRNLLVGPVFAFSPIISGVIYDIFGYGILFCVSILFMISGLIILQKNVKEYF
jgi:MFS-type transporter involved in bile tolerance (Atg22 family)